ncbi:MAG: phosphatase PAP2 family protein [Caldilineaceae bacterium]
MLVLLILSVAIYLLLLGRLQAMGFLIGAMAGGSLLSLILKELFARPRPDLVPHLSYVTTSSFPSGHSMLSAVTYLTLGALLARSTTSGASRHSSSSLPSRHRAGGR